MEQFDKLMYRYIYRAAGVLDYYTANYRMRTTCTCNYTSDSVAMFTNNLK